jgi:putative spermidine/putrescine transport system permease protein
VPGKFMVDALTVENYVKFFTDIYYYRGAHAHGAHRADHHAICLLMGFPLAYVLARTRTRYKNLLIMLVVLPLFVGNAVRAAGWMVAFGNKGVINASLMGTGAIPRRSRSCSPRPR